MCSDIYMRHSEYKHEIPTRLVTKKSHTYNLNSFILCAMRIITRLPRIVEENLRYSREFHLIVPDEYAKRLERMQAKHKRERCVSLPILLI